MSGFDDFLGLRRRDFSRARLVVFTGRSGSGKSTAIRFLLDEHPDVRTREQIVLEGPPFARFQGSADVIAIDELHGWRDLGALVALLGASRTLLVASHVGLEWFRAMHPLMPCAFFSTDRDARKIERHLARRGVAASGLAVRQFAALFGATYTDADLIVERYPDRSFDDALARFNKFCRVELSGPDRPFPPPHQ